MNKIVVKTVFLIAGFAIGGCGNRFSRIDPKDDVPSGYAQVVVNTHFAPLEKYFSAQTSGPLNALNPGTEVMLYIVSQADPSKMIATIAYVSNDATAKATFNVTIPYGSYTIAAISYLGNMFNQPYCTKYAENGGILVVDGTTTAISLSDMGSCSGSPFFPQPTANLSVVSCADSGGPVNTHGRTVTSSSTFSQCGAIPNTNPTTTPAISYTSFQFRYYQVNNLSPGSAVLAPSVISTCLQGNAFGINSGLVSMTGWPGGSSPVMITGKSYVPPVGSESIYRFPSEFAIFENVTAGINCGSGQTYYSYFFPYGFEAASANDSNIVRVEYRKIGVTGQVGDADSFASNRNNNAKYQFNTNGESTMFFFVRRGP